MFFKYEKIDTKSDNLRNLIEFFNNFNWNTDRKLLGEIDQKNDTVICFCKLEEFLSGNAAVYFLIRIPVRSRFVISRSADSMYF